MTKLPKGLTMSSLMRMRVPSDLTIAEVRAHMATLDEFRELRVHLKKGRELRVRFIRTRDESEFADDTPWGVFRTFCNTHKAKIVIDDQSGGIRVRETV